MSNILYTYTCATDADPNGLSSNSTNTSSNDSFGFNNSFLIIAFTKYVGIGSKSSVNPDNASVYCFGNKSFFNKRNMVFVEKMQFYKMHD